jgi:methylated-DNA-[protein]-cysteine S-methyltransferase
MKTPASVAYQAVVSAPTFRIGVRCDEMEILALDYLAPGPELAPKNALAAEAVRQLRAYFSDADFDFSLPLRPSGTAFQRRVWAQIAAIPKRETRTYGDVAKVLHNAPRAVGQACGANPFPLVVPCHRVIAAGGALGGFARNGGDFMLDVKRWLLAHERH